MTIDTAALRALAEAATPGPWREVSVGHGSVGDAALIAADAVRAGINTDLSWVDQADDEAPHIALVGNGPKAWHNGQYIAACSPDAILALLDEVERLREALTAVTAVAPMRQRQLVDGDFVMVCAMCSIYLSHNDDCPWDRARAALGVVTPNEALAAAQHVA